MVARLVKVGHDVAVLGRSAEKRAAVAQLGATAVADIADVTAGAEVVAICVFTDEQVRQICFEDGLLATMSRGSALVVHTTGSPRTVETIAARGAPHDVEVVDAPVSGGPHKAAAGALTLFVGGAEEAVARVRPVLGCYGDPILHVGPLGAGQKVKLVNNALFAAQIGLLSGSIELGARLGVPESTLLNALPHGSAAGPSRRSSTLRANSWAKTLAWSGVSPPNWAATWACSTTSSTRPSGHEMRSFRYETNRLPLALQSSIPS
jgi:2-hydroxy-3-oxopropionate reductase